MALPKAASVLVRMPSPLKAALEGAARKGGVSTNAEIVRRLERSFQQQTAPEELRDAFFQAALELGKTADVVSQAADNIAESVEGQPADMQRLWLQTAASLLRSAADLYKRGAQMHMLLAQVLREEVDAGAIAGAQFDAQIRRGETVDLAERNFRDLEALTGSKLPNLNQQLSTGKSAAEAERMDRLAQFLNEK
jgi:hypothetical protein